MLRLLAGVWVCATTGTLSLGLTPLAVALDEPVSRVVGGEALLGADFFLPNKKDMLRWQMGAIAGLVRSRELKGRQNGSAALHGGAEGRVEVDLGLDTSTVNAVVNDAEKQL